MRQSIKPLLIVGLSAIVYMAAPDSMSESCRRSAAIFVFAALSWAFEVFPLYATSILVVFLQILFLAKPDGVLGMGSTGYEAFLLPFGSPVVILFFGGLMLAGALQKHGLDRMMAARLLTVFGKGSFAVMTGFMAITAFLSMWMSNTAATALMMAMIIPILRQIDEKDPFRIALTLAIPFAANVGGIGTPIGTPPNAIALGLLANKGIEVSFLQWMKLAVPLMLLILAMMAIILRFLFPPKKNTVEVTIEAPAEFSNKAKVVSVIALATVILWLTSEWHHMPSSLVALFAMGTLTACGAVTKNDFSLLDWDVLVLMWGGLSLGKGMEISGLTQWVVGLPIFNQTGFVLVAVFCFLTVFVSTFMSNTATANLIVPLVMLLPGENQIVISVLVALCCSFAMALPISTPPNAIAFASRAISSRDMLKAGLLVSIVSIVIVLLGYKFMIPVLLK